MKLKTSMTFDNDLIWIPSLRCHQRQRLCGAERGKAGEERKPHEMPISLGWCNF